MGDGPNVGYATLSLIPSMKGSEAILARESTTAGGKAGGLFHSSFAKKIGGLGKAVGLGLAAGIVGAGVGLFKLGDSFDEQFDKIRVSSGKTGTALAGLQNDFKAVLSTTATDFNSAGDAISKVNQKLGLTGVPLQNVAKQLIDVSRITKTDLATNVDAVTGLFNNFGISVDDQQERLDQLYRASQASGIGIGDLASQMSSSGAILRSVGFDFEHGAALIGTLAKSGLSAGDVLPALSRSLKNAAEKGKPADKVLSDIFSKIKTSKTPIKAAALAVEFFGAKGGKMADLIRSGALSVDQMYAAINGGKDTITSATNDTADFSEKFQILKNRVLVGLEPIATKVFDAVGNGLDRLSEWWTQNGSGIQEWLSNFGASLNESIAPAAGKVFAAFKDDLLPKLQEFGEWLSTHQGAMEAFAAILFVIGAAVLIATAPILALVIGVIALATAVAYAYDRWTWFHTAVDDAVTVTSTLWEWLGRIVDVLNKVVDGATRAGDALSNIKIPGTGVKIPGLGTLGKLAGRGARDILLGPFAPIADLKDLIPGLDTGGMVPGRKGQPSLILAHGGEEVIPWHNQTAMRRYGALQPVENYETSWADDGHGVGDVILDGRKVGVAIRKRGRTGAVAPAA